MDVLAFKIGTFSGAGPGQSHEFNQVGRILGRVAEFLRPDGRDNFLKLLPSRGDANWSLHFQPLDFLGGG